MCQIFRFIFTFLALFCVGISSCLHAQQKIEGIAAVVGNEIVLESEIQEGSLGGKTSGKNNSQERCRFFEEMLTNQLILYYAKKDKLFKIEDQQVQPQVEEIIQGFEKQAGSKEALLRAYGRNTLGEIRQEITMAIKNRQYLQQYYEKITEGIEATPKQVKDFYDKNRDTLSELPEQVELAEIVFFPRITQAHQREIIGQLKKIKEDVSQGESFATKAIAYSDDQGSAVNGGLIKGVKRGQMVKEFEDVVFSMKEGEISDPFETKFGFHLLQLEKRKGQEANIRHILLKPKYTDQEMKTVKALADSVSALLADKKIDFQEALKKYSDEKTDPIGRVKNMETGTYGLDKNRLPLNITKHISLLKEGSTSKAYEQERDGYKVYVILKVLKNTPARKMSFSLDYQQLKAMTENDQKRMKLRSWVREHIGNVFIKVGKDYQSCSFENNWLKK